MDEIKIKDVFGLTYDNGKMYIISLYMPVIMVYDFLTKKTEKLCDYPRDMMDNTAAFEKVIKCDSKLYLFPCLAYEVYCYDILTGKFTKLLSLDSIGEDLPQRVCFHVLKYEKYVFAVCNNPHFIMRINSLNDDIQVWKPDYKRYAYNHAVNYPFSVCIRDDMLIYPYSSSLIIEFCIKDESFHFVNLVGADNDYPKKEYGYLQGLVMNNAGRTWVNNWYGELFEIVDNEMRKIEVPSELAGVYNDGVSTEIPKIYKIIYKNDKLYLLLQSDFRILVYDISSKKFSWEDNISGTWNEQRRKLAYTVYSQMEENSFLLFHYNESAIYMWDVNRGFTDKIEVKILMDQMDGDDYLYKCWGNNLSKQDDLETYLSYIKNVNNNQTENKEESCGEKIYHELLK